MSRVDVPAGPFAGQSAAEAIPILVETHGPQIYGLGLRMCGNEQDAEDMVQETFLRAFRRWDSFRGDARPSTWLYAIASRICGRMHRRRAGEPRRMESLSELLPREETTMPRVSTDDALDAQIQREIRDTVEAAIATLPATFRLPLILKELGDFSLAEIAAVLGVKAATVKTRVHRGRLALRRALASHLPHAPAPHPTHSRQMCLDLLRTKQEAMDRRVPFPLPDHELCARCRSLFATLDITQDACRLLRQESMPESVREMVLSRIASERRRG